MPDRVGAMGRLARTPRPDAAILDISLGGEMAFPLADLLQEKQIPVVFATGYDQEAIPETYGDLPRL